MYRLAVKYYAGGEVRVTTSLFSVKSPTGDDVSPTGDTPQGVTPPNGGEGGVPPLLDYSSELERIDRAGVSGHGELPIRVTKFNNEAKRTIQRCARALDGVVENPGDILFLTGTLPGSGQEQFMAMAQWSSWMVHRLKAWVAYYVPQKYDFYCWELQKRGALHLHYAVHCPDEVVSQKILDGFKAQWIRLLDHVGLETGVDMYQNVARGFSHSANKNVVQAKAERVIKGVGNYLGKYLSKSTQGGSEKGVFAPCRWWGVSRPLRDLEKSERVVNERFFTCSSQWHAMYEDCVKWMDVAGDVMHEWKNQVIPGKGAVIYGVAKQTMKSLIGMAMKTKADKVTSRQQLSMAWTCLREVLINVEINQRDWFGAMRRRLVVMRRWEEISGYSYDSFSSLDYVSSVQSLVANLDILLKTDDRVSVERLKYAWKSSLLAACAQMQDALNRVYAEEYKLGSDEDWYTAMQDEK